MSLLEEVEARIEEIEDDQRWDPDNPADPTINAPLALIQCSMEGRMKELKWMRDKLQDSDDSD